MSRWTQVRIFSPKRIVLSFVVGFAIPVTYVLTLFLLSEYTGRLPSQNIMMPVAWPRVLWDLLVDQPRSDANFGRGVLFITFCDTILYGAITYVALTAASVMKFKPVVLEPPPTPPPVDYGPVNSD